MTSKRSIKITDLRDLVLSALAALGLGDNDATIVADVLLYAELRGNSQGLDKILERTVVPPEGHGEIMVEASHGATLRLNVNQGPAMPAAVRASKEAASLAKAHGIGLCGMMNFSTSTGAIGYYAEKMASEGLIGIVMAGSPKVMAMTGGIDPVFGTNPIAIAVPTSGEPLLLDMATAKIAWFDIVAAKRRGDEIPEDTAVSADGKPTTHPADAMAGAMLAFGGHKGAGLALMIEALTGPLLGAGVVGDEDASSNRGCTFIAINPDAIVGRDPFIAAMDRMATRIRAGRPAPGTVAVTLPGDRSRSRRDASLASGEIEVDVDVLEGLRGMVRSVR